MTTIDIDTDANLPLVEGGIYDMSLGQRKLVSDFVLANFGGDLDIAKDRLTRNQSAAQLVNWELTVKNRASDWAKAKTAGEVASPGQLKAANFYALALFDPTPVNAAPNCDPQSAAKIKTIFPALRNKLVMDGYSVVTQGEFNAFRERVLGLVPTLIARNRDGSEHDATFEDVDPAAMTVPSGAPAGSVSPVDGDEEPF